MGKPSEPTGRGAEHRWAAVCGGGREWRAPAGGAPTRFRRDAAAASCRDGVLRIEIPRLERSCGHRVPVRGD